MLSQDDCGEKETTTEDPQQIHAINDEDYPSFLGSKFDTNQHTGTLADEAADGK